MWVAGGMREGGVWVGQGGRVCARPWCLEVQADTGYNISKQVLAKRELLGTQIHFNARQSVQPSHGNHPSLEAHSRLSLIVFQVSLYGPD